MKSSKNYSNRPTESEPTTQTATSRENGFRDYLYHDDPGNAPHPNDWWYFWIVYDTTAHSPSKVVYDFHHNLRALDWTDSRVYKPPENPFHPVVYLDAGGHRSLWDVGEDITLAESAYILTWGLAFHLDVGYGSFPRDVRAGDKTFGIMIKKLAYDNPPTIAGWRRVDKGGFAGWCGEWGYTKGISVILAPWTFKHMVWVAGVDANAKTINGISCSRIDYTGDNIPSVDDTTVTDYNYWPETGTYLPWSERKVSFASGQDGIKAISTTCMVWNWKQYQWDDSQVEDGKTVYYYNKCQDWTSSGTSPSIYTRYYDGSP